LRHGGAGLSGRRAAGVFQPIVAPPLPSPSRQGIAEPRRDEAAPFESIERRIRGAWRNRAAGALGDELTDGAAVGGLAEEVEGKEEEELEFAEAGRHPGIMTCV
jgi:hypothetical protein